MKDRLGDSVRSLVVLLFITSGENEQPHARGLYMSRQEKAQSLADLLLGAISEQDTCRFKNLLDSLGKDEREALDGALKSNVPTSRIARILSAEGHKINRLFLGEKRKCYLESESCQCRTKAK